MTPFAIEIEPLCRPTNGPEAAPPEDLACAEAARALLGMRGLSLVVFPDRG
jgi:hypothetical protein